MVTPPRARSTSEPLTCGSVPPEARAICLSRSCRAGACPRAPSANRENPDARFGPAGSTTCKARRHRRLHAFRGGQRPARFLSLALKPHLLLAEVSTPDGGRLSLYRYQRTYTIRLNDHGLMDSSMATSEKLLGDLALEAPEARARPRILIGGLGLGFTLDRVLRTTGPDAIIDVVELIPAVVDWNREHLLDLNGGCLADPRVTVLVDDVGRVIARAEPETYDSIVLDVDNGPIALVQRQNHNLYDHAGITQIIRALKRGGRVVIWSAGRNQRFHDRLTGWGLSVKLVPAKTHNRAKKAINTIYVVDRAE